MFLRVESVAKRSVRRKYLYIRVDGRPGDDAAVSENLSGKTNEIPRGAEGRAR